MTDDGSTTGDDLGSLGSLLGAIASTRQSPALPVGTLVGGQYEIVKAIGQGGMGVVYLARDRKLDRDVAIKVGLAMSPEALELIEREARALAKLAHPNVVVVYQVGSIDQRVFIAMEYIPETARSWLAAKQRTWREIVALYAGAGEGLAAAHEAGLVHRDFKPENVLVGGDGRPRVSDFGVARTGDDDEAGRVIGTPAYMSPEQKAGGTVDARADQFAFAVSLWEALFDERPAGGAAAPAKNPREVPRTVIASLRRALSVEAAARWPSMSALVGELRASLDRRRARWIFAGAALAVGAAGALVAMTIARSDGPACDTGADEIAGVWSPARRATLASNAALVAFVDARAASWATTHDAACKATHVEHTASAELLDRRMLCLATARADLDAALRLAGQSRDAAAQLVPFLETRRSPASCLDVANLDDEEPPPEGIQDKMDVAVAALAEASAAALDRAVSDPLAKTERAVAAARATGWRPIIARALEERGNVLIEQSRNAEAVQVLEESARLAVAGRADETAFYAYTRAASALSEEGRAAEAKQATATAQSLWERLGKPPHLGWKLYSTIADIARSRGDMKEALEAVRQRIVFGRLAYGNGVTYAQDNFDLAIMLMETGDLAGAFEAVETSIKFFTENLGAAHPTIGKTRVLRAMLSVRSGKVEAATNDALAGVAVLERWYGADDPRLINGLTIIAETSRMQGKFDDARAALQRALAIARKSDPKSRHVSNLGQNLALLAYSRGDFVEARTQAEAALAAAELRLGAEHVDLIDFLAVYSAILRDGPDADLARSEELLIRAQKIASAQLPDGHRRIVNLAIERSYTQVKANQAQAAIDALTPYVARIDKLQIGTLAPNELRFALAKAHAARGQMAKACALAEIAHRGYVEATSPEAKPVEEWRAKQCRR